MAYRQEIGAKGENLAETYLRERGYEILRRNFKRNGGEIDIIVRDGNTLVFVEVKTRTSFTFGCGAEAVNEIKRERLKKAASAWLYETGYDGFCRFDVMEIYFPVKGASPVLRQYKDAF